MNYQHLRIDTRATLDHLDQKGWIRLAPSNHKGSCLGYAAILATKDAGRLHEANDLLAFLAEPLVTSPLPTNPLATIAGNIIIHFNDNPRRKYSDIVELLKERIETADRRYFEGA